jgi:hypothetical protein
MTHYWFGDSWVVGDELELSVPMTDRGQYVFGKLVSDYFHADSVNLGVSGSSVDSLPWEFNKITKQIKTGDTIFFCLTAPHRTTILNDDKIPTQFTSGAPNYSKSAHPYQAKWFKYFDTNTHRHYNYDRSISLLWLWCQQLQVNCFFMNLFTTMTEKLFDIVPESCWLLPRHECASKFILPLDGNHDGTVISDDSWFLTTEQWESQQQYLEKYIRPGYCHPNISGHRIIADRLIALLETIHGMQRC